MPGLCDVEFSKLAAIALFLAFFSLRVCGDDFFLSRFARNLCLKRKVKCFVSKFDGVSTSPRKRVSYSETDSREGGRKTLRDWGQKETHL